jgi:hypothetical protein
VVLADHGRGFVQVVAAAGMLFLGFGWRFFPVIAELLFAAHGSLSLQQG